MDATTPRARLPFGEARKPVADFVFGVIAPVVCLVLDPIVFKMGMPSGPLGTTAIFAHWQAPVYLAVAAELVVLSSCVLTERPRSAVGNAAASGVLFVGAALSLGLGVLLFPLAVLGTFFVIGLLGFVPWLTAIVFLRHAARTARAAAAGDLGLRAGLLAGVVAMVAVVGPALGAAAIGRTAMDDATQSLREGRPDSVGHAVSLLSRWRLLVTMDDLVDAYRRTGDSTARGRIADAYQRVTGHSIHDRIAEFESID